MSGLLSEIDKRHGLGRSVKEASVGKMENFVFFLSSPFTLLTTTTATTNDSAQTLTEYSKANYGRDEERSGASRFSSSELMMKQEREEVSQLFLSTRRKKFLFLGNCIIRELKENSRKKNSKISLQIR